MIIRTPNVLMPRLAVQLFGEAAPESAPLQSLPSQKVLPVDSLPARPSLNANGKKIPLNSLDLINKTHIQSFVYHQNDIPNTSWMLYGVKPSVTMEAVLITEL